MIGVGLLLAALQVADPFGHLAVRVGDRVTNVPVVLTASGPMIQVDLLAAPLGAELRRLDDGQVELRTGGTVLEITPGIPFVRVADETFPLAAEPVVRDGRLLVPYQVVSEILPRIAVNLAFDASRGELRVLAQPKPARAADAGLAPPTAATSAPSRAPPPPAAPRREARRVIIVDAGHGGPDRGMTGPLIGGKRLYEKDVTLAVARALRSALTARGIDVIMTRDADTLIALDDRGRIANRRKGDAFISVHVNAANPHWRNPTAARGFETYFLSEAKTEDERRVEAMENEVVKYEVDTPATKGDALSFILHDMEQNQHLRESARFAEIVQRRLATVHPGPSRGVKQAGFRVLITSLMPAILVEIGFGSNSSEAAWMSSPARQREIAASIADATEQYLERYERRTSAGAADAQ